MAACRQRGTVGAVRINLLERDGGDDLRGVMPGAPTAVLLPHVERPEQIRALDAEIGALEQALGLPAGATEIVPTLNRHAASSMPARSCRPARASAPACWPPKT